MSFSSTSGTPLAALRWRRPLPRKTLATSWPSFLRPPRECLLEPRTSVFLRPIAQHSPIPDEMALSFCLGCFFGVPSVRARTHTAFKFVWCHQARSLPTRSISGFPASVSVFLPCFFAFRFPHSTSVTRFLSFSFSRPLIGPLLVL